MKVFVSLAEISASNYIYHIFKDIRGFELYGITDRKLESIGFKSVASIEDLSVVGIVEAIPKVPYVLRLYKKLEDLLPCMDAIILCDAPAFNLPLLKRIKGKVKKVIYFISPQVWAWKSQRANLISSLVDHLIVLFPFELEFYQAYRKRGFNIHYVGHPIVDIVKPTLSREEVARILGSENLLGLLPGSRWSEIKRHAPYLRKVYEMIYQEHGLFGALPTFETFREFLEEIFHGLPVGLITEKNSPTPSYDVMSYSVASLIASGTADLEASLLLNPHIVFYKVNPITYLIGKRLARVKNIALTNLVLQKNAVPEVIQRGWKELYFYSKKLLLEDKVRHAMVEDFKELRGLLGGYGVLDKLRELFLSLLDKT
ncbi:MAG: lipid-A-disaccharide synthase [Aquificaceae bacterium]